VLATYVRARRLTAADAFAVMDRALGRMNRREFKVAPQRALMLAADSGCSAYDCEFVALAQELGVPLVTVDREVPARFPDDTVSLADFAGRTRR
jgi:predicted nucleic acid-binding protein